MQILYSYLELLTFDISDNVFITSDTVYWVSYEIEISFNKYVEIQSQENKSYLLDALWEGCDVTDYFIHTHSLNVQRVERVEKRVKGVKQTEDNTFLSGKISLYNECGREFSLWKEWNIVIKITTLHSFQSGFPLKNMLSIVLYLLPQN